MVSRRINGQVRPYIRSSKPRFNWSDELKQLFDDAVRDLGCPRKATPKRIRELMKCSDIQLSHIKSRLQMCRIRMEEGRRSEEIQSRRKSDSVDNGDANGDEHSVVVDENEPVDAGPSLSLPNHFSPKYDQIYPRKRLRMETQIRACWSPSIQGSSHEATTQFYFDYFDPSQLEWRAVAEFSCDNLFRDEQSDAFKEIIVPEEEHNEQNSENDKLQLSLSLSTPESAKKINLDLSMAVLGS